MLSFFRKKEETCSYLLGLQSEKLRPELWLSWVLNGTVASAVVHHLDPLPRQPHRLGSRTRDAIHEMSTAPSASLYRIDEWALTGVS
jgi:hypothetical protein